jgi:hypothetical protein
MVPREMLISLVSYAFASEGIPTASRLGPNLTAALLRSKLFGVGMIPRRSPKLTLYAKQNQSGHADPLQHFWAPVSLAARS